MLSHLKISSRDSESVMGVDWCLKITLKTHASLLFLKSELWDYNRQPIVIS